MNGPALVTGYGVRTAFGGEEATRSGVFAGRAAFGPVTRFDTGRYRTAVAATGAASPTVAEALGETADAAVATAGLAPDGRTGVFVGTAGDFVALRDFWRDRPAEAPPEPGLAGAGLAGAGLAGAGRTQGVPAAGPTGAAPTVPAWQAATLADRIGAGGPRLAFTNACVASAAAIIHACRLIAAGRLDAAVCAGAYLVEEENFAKFNSGRAMARDGRVRPFSAGRSGLLLGDGAAAVVLESPEHAARRGAAVLAAVTGWGDASDGYHIAKPHPRGTGLAAALRSALDRAGTSTVDYVNAHGTGTPLNDPAESRGLSAVLGERAGKVPVSSTKGATGHLLEAAGAVEFVLTLLALRDSRVPPTAGFTAVDPDCDLDCVPDGPRTAPLRRVATVNAAFGGANTALVLESP